MIFRKRKRTEEKLFLKTFNKFKDYTMIPEDEYIRNLQLAKQVDDLEGVVVECGVWRGGMIAGIAFILDSKKKYYLFDSFEGLPPAKPNDGIGATKWQSETDSPVYFDNCKAEITFAQTAMKMALNSMDDVHIVKGWFSETLVDKNFNEKISLLRLDGDWYDSTMECLEFFFPKVILGGLIIIDDYHFWEGCSKAVHDYLSNHKSFERISQFDDRTAFIRKK